MWIETSSVPLRMLEKLKFIRQQWRMWGSMTFRVELDNPSHFSLGTQNRLLRS